MAKDNTDIPENMLNEAALWVVRLGGGEGAPAHDVEAKFRDWLAADPRHMVAFETLRAVWTDVDELRNRLETGRNLPGRSLRDTILFVRETYLRPRGHRVAARRYALWLGACVSSIFAGAVLFAPYLEFRDAAETAVRQAEPEHFETSVGERREAVLSDGSILMLNTDTTVTVALTPHERRVVLHHGEAYFNVARDPARAFNVVVGGTTVTAVGTEYNIRYRGGLSTVTVFEGEVDVKNRLSTGSAVADGREALRVREGQAARLDSANVIVHDVPPEALARTLGWQEGRLYFDAQPLGEIVAELNHYIPDRIVITDQEVSSYVGGGVFFVDNVESVLNAFELTWPVRIVRTPGVILITPDESRAR